MSLSDTILRTVWYSSTIYLMHIDEIFSCDQNILQLINGYLEKNGNLPIEHCHWEQIT